MLGNGNSARDWHHAWDTMNGAWMSLQQKVPREYVFASGVARTVKTFALDVCKHLNIDKVDKAILFSEDEEKRPWEVPYLCGDPLVAETFLGWPMTHSYEDLIKDVCTVPMVNP
jgi:GDPmannose 4,6-dehydratase